MEITKAKQNYMEDFTNTVGHYVESLATLNSMNKMIKNLEEEFAFVLTDAERSYEHKTIYISAQSVHFFNYTYKEMKAIQKYLRIKDLEKEQSKFDVSFKATYNGYKLRFNFDIPKTCNIKYKKVRKKVSLSQIETDVHGDTFVLDEVFDGYDCSEKSMVKALKGAE